MYAEARLLWARLSCQQSCSGNSYGLLESADSKDALFLFAVEWWGSKKIMNIPTTSTTLLRDIASSAENARWGEFVALYEPMMKAYLQSHFPGLEADDIIQNTLLALMKALPEYHHQAGEKENFHNYLTGILRHKALDALRQQQRHNKLLDAIGGRARVDDPADGRAGAPCTPDSFTSGMAVVPPTADARLSPAEQEYRDWRESIYEIVLQEFMDDENVSDQTKQIFVRTQIKGEDAEKVMSALGVTRETIDHANSRCRNRLRERIKALRDL